MPATAKQALYSLINRDNGTDYNESTVSLGAVEVNTDPMFANENTTTVLTALPGSGRVGTVAVYWNRRQIIEVTDGEIADLVWDTELRTVDLIPQFNALYRINLQPEDIVDADIPEGIDDISEFEVLIAGTSYGWLGAISVKLTRQPTPIEDEVEAPSLDGFDLDDLQDPAQ